MVFFNSTIVTDAPANGERVSASLTVPRTVRMHCPCAIAENKRKNDMAAKNLMVSFESQN
jgi:hypothetical protein